MKREIIIGDVQGCHDEFLRLLDKVAYRPDNDRLYLAGDVLNRGPDSRAVLDFLMARPAIRSVMGNHEYWLLRYGTPAEAQKHPGVRKVAAQLAPAWEKYLGYLRGFPPYIETESFILVHAGFPAGTHPAEVDLKTLISVRELPDENGQFAPWYDGYTGDKLVIFGHWAKQGLVRKGRVRGLDTGCVYGRKLTALVLPEDRIVQIDAARAYFDPSTMQELW